MIFTFLLDVTAYTSCMLWWYSQGSFLVTIPRKGVDINSKTPILVTHQFWIILERLFTCIASPAMWGKAGMEFITSNGPKISGEAAPMVILVTDGVGEGNLDMVTTFCCHSQAELEASDALSAQHQWNLLEPSVVVVRMYTSTPFLPQGSSYLLYLDVSTLSRDASSTQIPLDWLHLHKLFPFSDTEVVLLSEEVEMGLKVFPQFQEALWQSSEEEHCLSDPISLSIPILALHPYQEEGTQTEGGSGFHPALKLLQDANQARAQLEYEFVQETQELAQRYDNKQIKQTRRCERCWAWMVKQTDATFQEVFPRQVWQIPSSYCLGSFPLQFPSATWVEWWPPLCNRMRISLLYPSLRAHQLQAPQAF